MVKINREYNLLPFVVVVVMIRGFLLVGGIFICGFHLKSESLNFIGFEMNGFEVISTYLNLNHPIDSSRRIKKHFLSLFKHCFHVKMI